MAAATLAFLPNLVDRRQHQSVDRSQQSGYSVKDEAPIFLIVLGVPAAVAFLLWWRLKSGN